MDATEKIQAIAQAYAYWESVNELIDQCAETAIAAGFGGVRVITDGGRATVAYDPDLSFGIHYYVEPVEDEPDPDVEP